MLGRVLLRSPLYDQQYSIRVVNSLLPSWEIFLKKWRKTRKNIHYYYICSKIPFSYINLEKNSSILAVPLLFILGIQKSWKVPVNYNNIIWNGFIFVFQCLRSNQRDYTERLNKLYFMSVLSSYRFPLTFLSSVVSEIVYRCV